jgi:hypothetical protein
MELHDVLGQVTVQKAVEWRNVQVFPLLQPNGHDPSYVLIDDLLEGGQAEIGELDEHGAVGTISVRNRAGIDALILDGTELRGAKQNRMVNITIIVGHGTETPIPVSCVEQGRWAYRSRHFGSTKRTVAGRLRNLKAHMVSEHLAREGRVRTDQVALWDQVDAYVANADVAAPTAALDDVFTARQPNIDEVVARLKEIDAYGAVVVVNGEIVALDLVDHRKTFHALWESLLRGYAMDAVGEDSPKAKRLTKRQIETWLKVVTKEVTLTRHDQGRVVHTALFPAASRFRSDTTRTPR